MSVERTARTRVQTTRVPEGLDALRTTQLASGEMVSYLREPEGAPRQAHVPLVSALVHDALGCFDRRSPGWDERSLRCVEQSARSWLVVQPAVRLRRRIRRYLIWQSESEGGWRLFGWGSESDACAVTTACAATALLETPGREARARRVRHLEAIERFRSADGLYHCDPAVNAEVLRLLVLTASRSIGEVTPVIRFVRDHVRAGQPPDGLFSNPLCFYHSAARAWRQARLPDADGLASDLVPRVLAMQDASGGFGGPLSSALAVATLLDLGCEGEELERGLAAVARARHRWGGWGADDFMAGGIGSPAWTTALSIAALARGACRGGGGAGIRLDAAAPGEKVSDINGEILQVSGGFSV